MAYVINAPCIGVKDNSCVEVCPVDCIHPSPDEPDYDRHEMLYIDPEECIDCDACVEACPVDAITAEDSVPPEWQRFIEINAAYYRETPRVIAPSSPLSAHSTAAALGQLHRSLQRSRTGVATAIRDGGARLGRAPLDDELRTCLTYLEEAPERFEQAAVAWHARWSCAATQLTLADSLVALGAVQALAGPGSMPAADALRTLSTRHGLDEVAAVLSAWVGRVSQPSMAYPVS